VRLSYEASALDAACKIFFWSLKKPQLFAEKRLHFFLKKKFFYVKAFFSPAGAF
jgi:hypothetical protein